ncbi:hypothetical protein K1719_028492 [Acacia pycnantha]|nr:hypothetical protein K1719_028492 [Acacia pycnantha]
MKGLGSTSLPLACIVASADKKKGFKARLSRGRNSRLKSLREKERREAEEMQEKANNEEEEKNDRSLVF